MKIDNSLGKIVAPDAMLRSVIASLNIYQSINVMGGLLLIFSSSQKQGIS